MYYMISTIYDQGLMLIEKQNMIFEYPALVSSERRNLRAAKFQTT